MWHDKHPNILKGKYRVPYKKAAFGTHSYTKRFIAKRFQNFEV